MTRRIGYLTAGGRPGDLTESFWTARSHYSYVETTIPQSEATINSLKSWYRKSRDDAPNERIIAGYSDLFYCGTRDQSNISEWRRSTLPAANHPCFVRDEAGAIIPRFAGRGLFVPRPGSTTGRAMVVSIVSLSLQSGIHIRLDDHSRDLGWDFTGFYPGGVQVPHNKIVWDGKVFTKVGTDFIAADGTSFSAIYARAADDYIQWIRGYGGEIILIVNSGTKWLNGSASMLSGRMQERNITRVTFAMEPWNRPPLDKTWPMALTYPDTYDTVIGLAKTGALPNNVVVVETHDMNGRVIEPI